MRIFNDYIEYSAGVNSSTAGMSIGLGYSVYVPPTNGLIVQGNVGINTYATSVAGLTVWNGLYVVNGISTVNQTLNLNANLQDLYNRSGTLGQVLVSTGQGVAWSSLVQEGVVTGNIQQFQVAYGAGNSQIQGSNALFFTGTSLGVGTSSMISRVVVQSQGFNSSVLRVQGLSGTLFEVFDSLTGTLQQISNISGQSILQINDGLAAANVIVSQQGFGQSYAILSITTSNGVPVAFIASTVTYLSPFVGINTLNPTQALHVNGGTRLQGGVYDSNNNVGLAGSVLASNGSTVVWQASSTGNVTGVFAPGEIIYAGNNNSILGVTTFVYVGLGSVGIGTPSPQYFLSVVGNANITNTLLLNNGYVNQGTGINTNIRVTGSLFDSNNSAGSNNWVLTSNGTNPVWNSPSNAGILTGLGTPNTVPKYGAVGGSLVNSSITDNGTIVTISEGLTVSGSISTVQTLDLNNSLLDYNNSHGFQGQVLTSMGSPGIAWSSVSALGIITGAGTLNNLNKFGPNNTLINSSVSDNGTLVTVSENMVFLTGYINQGTGVNTNIVLTGTFADKNSSVGAAGQVLTSTVTGVAWSSVSFLGFVTGSGTPNTIAKFGPTGGSITNSSITDNGTSVSISEPTTVNSSVLVSGGNLTVTQNLYIQGTAIVSGGLTVLGTSTIVQTQYLNVYDPIISIGDESVAYDTYLRGIVMEYFPITGIGTTGFMGASAPNYDTFSYYSQIQYAGTAPTNSSFIQLGNSRFQNGFYLGNVYISGTGVATNLTVTNYALLQTGYVNQSLGINTNIRLTGTFADTNNSVGSAGQVLTSTVAGVAWSSLTFLGILTGYGTPNTLPKYGAVGGSLVNSSISDNGTLVTITEDVVFTNGYINQGMGVNTNLRLTGNLFDSNNASGSLGQFLAATGSGVAWSSVAAAGFITGVVGPTQIAFGAGNNALTGVSTFVYYQGNVGIGTIFPTQFLDIAQNTRFRGGIYDSTNSPGVAGNILTSTVTGVAWSTLTFLGLLTGFGTPNTLTKYGTVGGSLVNSSITDNGTVVTISENLNVTGSISTVNSLEINASLIDFTNSHGLQGQVLTSMGSPGIAWSSLSQIGILTGLGTPNTVPKYGAVGGSLVNSSISDNGTLVTITEGLNVTGVAITGLTFFGFGTFITNLNASNLFSGTVPSSVVSGTYSGITSVGTLTSLNVTGITTINSLYHKGTFYDVNAFAGIAGEVLTSTGAGVAWSSLTQTGILTGFGTPNTLPKYGAVGGSLVNSSVTDNGTFVNISDGLNVAGSISTVNTINLNGSLQDFFNRNGNLGQVLTSLGAPGVAWSSFSQIGLTTGTVGPTQVAFGQGNNALLGVATFVYQNANFGVGTVLPQTTMHVVGTSRVDGTFIVNAESADLRNQRVFAGANLSTSLVAYTGIASIFVPPGYCLTVEGKINGFSTSLTFSECGKYVSSFYNTGPGVVMIDTVDIWSKYAGTSSGNFTVVGIGSYATVVVRSDSTASLWYWRTNYDYLLTQNS